jgi:hypothetical protein
VQLQRLTEGRRCGGTIACDTPVTATLGTAVRADTNAHSFPGVANERVHISIAPQSGTNFEPLWRLVGPTGNHVCGFSGAHADCVLPTTGSYAIEVQDNLFNGTGTYSLHLQRLTDQWRCGGQARCGVALTPTVGTAARADTNVHSFGGVAGQGVLITLANLGGTTFNPLWRVVRPDGATACGFASATGQCLLPVSGSYGIEVFDSSYDGNGTYRITVSGPGCTGLPNLSISSLTCAPSASPGASLRVDVRTANIGDALSAASVTRLFLSSNSTLDASDVRLTPTVSLNALAAGGSALHAPIVTIPASIRPGSYFVIAESDTNHTVAEGNERNNTRSRALTVATVATASSSSAPLAASGASPVVSEALSQPGVP